MYTLYGIKTCDSVNKAIKWLNKHQVDYCFFDLKTNELPKNKLKKFIKFVGKDKILNKRSKTWKNLTNEIKQRLDNKQISNVEFINILLRYPLLIKRPIIEKNNFILVGFSEPYFKL